MDGELVRLTGTEWAVLDCLWEASPQTMTQLAHTLACLLYTSDAADE